MYMYVLIKITIHVGFGTDMNLARGRKIIFLRIYRPLSTVSGRIWEQYESPLLTSSPITVEARLVCSFAWFGLQFCHCTCSCMKGSCEVCLYM